MSHHRRTAAPASAHITCTSRCVRDPGRARTSRVEPDVSEHERDRRERPETAVRRSRGGGRTTHRRRVRDVEDEPEPEQDVARADRTEERVSRGLDRWLRPSPRPRRDDDGGVATCTSRFWGKLEMRSVQLCVLEVEVEASKNCLRRVAARRIVAEGARNCGGDRPHPVALATMDEEEADYVVIGARPRGSMRRDDDERRVERYARSFDRSNALSLKKRVSTLRADRAAAAHSSLLAPARPDAYSTPPTTVPARVTRDQPRDIVLEAGSPLVSTPRLEYIGRVGVLQLGARCPAGTAAEQRA